MTSWFQTTESRSTSASPAIKPVAPNLPPNLVTSPVSLGVHTWPEERGVFCLPLQSWRPLGLPWPSSDTCWCLWRVAPAYSVSPLIHSELPNQPGSPLGHPPSSLVHTGRARLQTRGDPGHLCTPWEPSVHVGSKPLLHPGPLARSSWEPKTTDYHRTCGRSAQGHPVSVSGLPSIPSPVSPPIRAVLGITGVKGRSTGKGRKELGIGQQLTEAGSTDRMRWGL